MSGDSFHIQQIKLTNFKNYSFKTVDFSPKLNFIVGNNGIGKTNLLDAIYYSCLTKSYLSSSDLMVPNFSDQFFRIETHFVLNDDNQLLEVKYLKQEKKEVLLDKVKVEKQAAFIGRFPCVIITPDDNQLILGASELRRKFMDATLCQFSSAYLANLLLYNKILAQRNALLKSFFENRSFDRQLLDVYDEKLIGAGQLVFEQRKSFLAQFIPVFKEVYRQIFDGKEEISITYDSDLLNKDYQSLIIESREQDRHAQRSTRGIHTDDLVFELNGFPVKKIGSQGQQKTFLLSLKLAQYELLKSEKHIRPLLLLDDIFDKLDADRMSRIFQLVNGDAFGQVFITDTDETAIRAYIEENKISTCKIIPLGAT